MNIDIKSAALKLDVQLPTREFVGGSVIDAAVRGVAERDLTVAGGRVDLIRTVTYRYRYRADECSLTPARSAEVVTRQALSAGGRYVSGEQLYEPVCLDVPADGPGSVTGDLVRIQWAVHAHLRVEPPGDAEATRKVVVFSRASDRALVERNPPVWQDRRCAVLAFESLSSRRLVRDSPPGSRCHRVGRIGAAASPPGTPSVLRYSREVFRYGGRTGRRRKRADAAKAVTRGCCPSSPRSGLGGSGSGRRGGCPGRTVRIGRR